MRNPKVLGWTCTVLFANARIERRRAGRARAGSPYNHGQDGRATKGFRMAKHILTNHILMLKR